MNKDEIIKELDKQNIQLGIDLSLKEDELLKTKYLLERADKEIERLNNIINELEEELEYRISYGEDEEGETYRLMTLEDKIILEKLQELKGENK